MKNFKTKEAADKAWTELVHKMREADNQKRELENGFKEKINAIIKSQSVNKPSQHA